MLIGGESVDPAAPGRGGAPFAGDQTVAFESVQRRMDGAFQQIERAVRALPKLHDHRVSIGAAELVQGLSNNRSRCPRRFIPSKLCIES